MSTSTNNLPHLPLLLLLLLLNQPVHQVQASALLASHMDVFSDLLENIMYSVIRTDNSHAGDLGGEDHSDDYSDDYSDDDGDDDDVRAEAEPARKVWRESKSRRRVLRTGGVGGSASTLMKTKETNKNQTKNFFRSKKIVSRQRNRNKENILNRSRKTGERRDRVEEEQEDSLTGPKHNVDERLQKVKHLFELIKVSKRQKTRSQGGEENVKSRFNNFPIRRRAIAQLGDNSNDAILQTDKTDKKVSKVSALENLYRIAGEDWVKTHIQR